MILALLLIQGFRTVLAPSILVPFENPARQYFPQVYNVSLSQAWNIKHEFTLGMYGEIFMNNSDLYSDPYLQNPNFNLKLLVYGLGGCFDFQINEYLSVGAGLGIYRLGFKFPYVKEGGEVVDMSNTTTNLGFYSSFSLTKSYSNWRLGTIMKIYLIGKADDYYYYPPYGYFENTAYFPSRLQGISLGLTLGYEK